MDNVKANYFKEIKESLSDNSVDTNYVYENGQSFVLMPLQYKYTHNLKTGLFEDVEGVDKILGYRNNDFTLEFYYSILHPEDLEIVFEMTRKGTAWANENRFLRPGHLQLSVLHRIKRISGEYAYIYRQSIIYETLGSQILRTFSICSDVTELGMKAMKPANLLVPEGKYFNYAQVFNRLEEKLFQSLTIREREVAFWAMEGYTSDKIALKLSISKHTVDTHRRNILKKTGLSSTVELREALFISTSI